MPAWRSEAMDSYGKSGIGKLGGPEGEHHEIGGPGEGMPAESIDKNMSEQQKLEEGVTKH